MKIGVVGSRSFNDYYLIKKILDKYKDNVTCIVSGGARGADSLAEKWADDNNVSKEIYYPDWNKHGKAAGYIRNVEIVKNSDLIIAFWDGLSKGTEHSINITKERKKELEIIYFNKVI